MEDLIRTPSAPALKAILMLSERLRDVAELSGPCAARITRTCLDHIELIAEVAGGTDAAQRVDDAIQSAIDNLQDALDMYRANSLVAA